MLIALHVGQIWNQFWWLHLVVKFWTNTSGTTYNWPNLEPMQVEFYLAGEITQVTDAIPWVRCASGNVFSRIPVQWTMQWSTGIKFTWPYGHMGHYSNKYPFRWFSVCKSESDFKLDPKFPPHPKYWILEEKETDLTNHIPVFSCCQQCQQCWFGLVWNWKWKWIASDNAHLVMKSDLLAFGWLSNPSDNQCTELNKFHFLFVFK